MSLELYYLFTIYNLQHNLHSKQTTFNSTHKIAEKEDKDQMSSVSSSDRTSTSTPLTSSSASTANTSSTSSSEALPVMAPLAIPTASSTSSHSLDLAGKFLPITTANTTNNSKSTFTATGYTNNVNSMYMQDEDASIAIHHHHFNGNHLSKPSRPVLHSKSLHTIEQETQLERSRQQDHQQQANYQFVLPSNQMTSLRSKPTERVYFEDGGSSSAGNEPNTYNLKSATLYRSNQHRCIRATHTSYSKYQTKSDQQRTVNKTALDSRQAVYWPLHLRTTYQIKGYFIQSTQQNNLEPLNNQNIFCFVHVLSSIFPFFLVLNFFCFPLTIFIR